MAYAILRKSADQSISNNTVTDVTWDTTLVASTRVPMRRYRSAKVST